MDTASERPGGSAARTADKMDVDGQSNGGELKIRGQADAERRKEQMDVDQDTVCTTSTFLIITPC